MLPIVAYGSPILRKKSIEVDFNNSEIDKLIEEMFETLEKWEAVGLAAPQVNKSLRLFIIDANRYSHKYKEAKNFVKVFINPTILEEFGDDWLFEESCLSLPGISEPLIRKSNLRIQYFDRNFNLHNETYSGILARIIQHEYDHLEGILFIDRLSPLRKTLLKSKLHKISKGQVETKHQMIFYKTKKHAF